MSLRRFESKTVIVTGAGQGIGKAVAERFAEEGADVMITGRRPEVLESVVAGIEAAGGSAWAFRADVSDPGRRRGFGRRGDGALGAHRRPRQQRRDRRGGRRSSRSGSTAGTGCSARTSAARS